MVLLWDIARKAFELGENEYGTDHTKYAGLLNNLAELYRAQGRYGENPDMLAEELHEEGVPFSRILWAPRHDS